VKKVVTSFLQSDSQILLLRRSEKVGTYRRRWAGVSGYVEQSERPLQRAMIEIAEEVGVGAEQVSLVRAGEPLRVLDEEAQIIWVIFPFLFETHDTTISIDWEHTEYKWVDPDTLQSFEIVPKLREAFERVRWDFSSGCGTLVSPEAHVSEIAQDRVHGASFLGQRSLEVLREVSATSHANSAAELFRDLLFFTLRLRSAQPSMATIRNLTGIALERIAAPLTGSTPIREFKGIAEAETERALQQSTEAAEDASRTALRTFPVHWEVLTHSYSNTVKRALELAHKSKHELSVLATESAPGLEGKRLANDLVSLGISVRLVADSAVDSMISAVDAVVVGADSILSDGSVVNKIGTSQLARLAAEQGKPVYVICETAKFSTQDFLGESVEIHKTLFDITPNKYVSSIITEDGRFEPHQVQDRIGKMVSQLYP
jgi:translation initiation factor 2B subunit (eIF-2B alpha/beta/delta family)/ADP-ribose pyrophosphatase YjhB (NUDIX family)